VSAAKIILDSVMPTLAPWQADERGVIVLTVLPDVVVNVVEDETSEEVHFFSAAGYPDGREAVSLGVCGEVIGEGKVSVHMAQQTGLIMALRTLARRQLNEQVFVKELGGHVQFTRALAAVLSPTRADGAPGTAPDDGDATTWLPCEATVDAERSEAEPLPPEPMTQHQD